MRRIDVGTNKHEPLGDGQCPSVHIWSDARCIRRGGHEGRCRSRTYTYPEQGRISHTEWISKRGEFYMHSGYHTRYPANMQRVTEGTDA